MAHITQTRSHRPSTTLVIVLLGLLLSLTVATTGSVSAQKGESVPADQIDGDIAAKWMDELYRLVQAEAVNAPAAARIYGYAGITLYESVVNGMPGNYSLAGQVHDLPDMPLPNDMQIYDWPSVANGAMSTVFEELFVEPSADTLQAIADLREDQTEARAADVGPQVVEQSLIYGDEIGATILEWVAADGYTELSQGTYELPTGDPSYYTQTTEGAPLIGWYWGQLRPFGISYAEVCHVYPDVPFSTDPDSTFYAQADEVREVGMNLTEEQQEIARFWLDTPGQTGAPAGHWVSIENQLVEQLNLNLQQAAGMYVLVNMSLADSFISIWSLKYEILLLRPETYIREYISRSWQPYIQTPPFPEYPSGHSGTSAAAAEILTSLFGPVAFTDRTHIIYRHEPLQRSFTSFEAAASEAAISRMYGGIHYRSAIENGMRQGRCVGQQILNNIQLGPIEQGE
jgi:hypothetical protein